MKCIVYVTVLRPTIDLPVGAMCQESPACRSGICGRCPGQTFNICIDGNASQYVDAAVPFPGVGSLVLVKPHCIIIVLIIECFLL